MFAKSTNRTRFEQNKDNEKINKKCRSFVCHLLTPNLAKAVISRLRLLFKKKLIYEKKALIMSQQFDTERLHYRPQHGFQVGCGSF